jgi:hypothetical protein
MQCDDARREAQKFREAMEREFWRLPASLGPFGSEKEMYRLPSNRWRPYIA